MDLEQIIAAILAFGDKPALRNALKERAKVDIYQHFFNDGHAVATGEFTGENGEKTKLEQRATAAEQRATAAEQKLTEWKAANPEPAKVIEQYETALRTQKEEYEGKLAAKDQENEQKDISRTVKSLRDTLIGKGVIPIHANAIVKDDALLNRIKPYNGSVRVLQKDKDIAIAEPDLDKALGLLADEVIAGLDPEQLNSKVSRGSGRGTTTGDAGANGKTDVAEEHRADIRRKYGRDDDGDDDSPRAPRHRQRKGDAKERLNQRLGLRSR